MHYKLSIRSGLGRRFIPFLLKFACKIKVYIVEVVLCRL
jgi:hypothetical protein